MWVLWKYEEIWKVGYWDFQKECYYHPKEYEFKELSQAEAKVHFLNG
jgi:hypothetical protein